MKRLLAACLLLLPVHSLADERVITLSGLPIWDSAPLLSLAAEQPLEGEGILFEFQPWRAPEELGAGLVRQDIHVASAPGMLAPIFAARGLELSLLGTSAVSGNVKIVWTAEGGEIAVPFKGGMPDLILQSVGERATWTPRYTGTPPEAMQFLLSGQTSAAFLAEPLATVAEFQAQSPLKTQDICPLWKSAHGLDHCPALGVYLGAGLSEAEAEAIGNALALAHEALARDPARAEALLKAQFPTLAQAPLDVAFAKLTPGFQPRCETSWLMQTLAAVEPFAQFTLGDEPLYSEEC